MNSITNNNEEPAKTVLETQDTSSSHADEERVCPATKAVPKHSVHVPNLKMAQAQAQPGTPLDIFGYGNSVFHVRSMEEIVNDPNNLVPPVRLFGDYVYQDEVCLLAGDTNVGKSLAGMDIALAVATGKNYWGKNVVTDQTGMVVLIDTELSDRQYARRYPNLTAKCIYRASFRSTAFAKDTMDDVINGVEKLFGYDKKPKLIILDNFTTLSERYTMKEAYAFATKLRTIKDRFKCTLVIIVHTNKVKPNLPITKEMLRGGKMVLAIADQIIALGNTRTSSDIKYVKILKTRNDSIPDTVSTLRIIDKPYLHFELVEEDVEEADLLPIKAKTGPKVVIDDELSDEIEAMKNAGMSYVKIADMLGIGLRTIQRNRKERGLVDNTEQTPTTKKTEDEKELH